jgi:phosphohistidine swiveling domain-containing protein
MKKKIFSSKAKNLLNLKLKKTKIPKSIFFNVKEFKENKYKIIKKIQKNFIKKIIVRSSNNFEDSNKSSLAGNFVSVLGVNPKNKIQLINSIFKVINSYKKFYSEKNEVLIQDFITGIKMSGVATSCDLKTYSSYITINFSNEDNTSAITSGKKNYKTFVFLRKSKIEKKYYLFRNIISLINQLMIIFNNEFIEIEFAINKKNTLYLFQVRPIIKNIENNISINFANNALVKLEKKILKLQKKHHNLLGNTTAFGVMPDWNPAEIIGTKPKPLALSLYQELITDHTWSLNRKDYGFRDLTSNHLMASFFGMPYIDVRVDFNSWIYSNLNKNLANKLVNYYLKQFKKHPQLHDKTEFEILFTCLTPSTNKKLKKLQKFGFKISEINEIKKSLKIINEKAFGQYSRNISEIEKLKSKQDEVMKSNMYYIDKIYWLVEDCKRFGTYSFAGLARCGFIATDILNAFVEEKIFLQNEKEKLLKNIQTVASLIQVDSYKLTKNDFIKKHGHIRPNTYEITSKNYKDGYNLYFKKNKISKNYKVKKFKLQKHQISKISKFIKINNLNINYKQLMLFIQNSISNREYAKHVFTKSIDNIFEVLKFIGKRHSIELNDLSYLKIQTILNLYYNLSFKHIKNLLVNEICENKKEFKINSFFKLPEIIYSSKDIYSFLENEKKINFIGSSVVIGKPYLIEGNQKYNLKNKIICIKNADPGYDFIFSQKIVGLITQYGGVNSHMAVRCAELSIPAAVGVGQSKFESVASSKIIRLDCETNKIDLIK